MVTTLTSVFSITKVSTLVGFNYRWTMICLAIVVIDEFVKSINHFGDPSLPPAGMVTLLLNKTMLSLPSKNKIQLFIHWSCISTRNKMKPFETTGERDSKTQIKFTHLSPRPKMYPTIDMTAKERV